VRQGTRAERETCGKLLATVARAVEARAAEVHAAETAVMSWWSVEERRMTHAGSIMKSLLMSSCRVEELHEMELWKGFPSA
jgi:hypothetical protein